MMRSLVSPAAVLLMLALGYFCYQPGLAGGFLFDDYPNLKDLGAYGGVTDWNTFKAFVFSGWSGPTGRPLSLLSFLLDDNTWPSHAAWFKITNLLIHLLNGLLLCWATLLLLRNHKVDERHAIWLAILSSAIWLLHPYFVSTTLYVVQRMAQLATLFVLAGFVGYLKGRLMLQERKAAAYSWMSVSLIGGTILALLSKENGALLPLLVLTAECCMPQTGKPDWRWRLLFLWGPSIAIAGLLLSYVDFSENPWPTRPFNQVERLLTEGRIVSEYLLHLFMPRIEGSGLFQDGYVISKGWLSPPATLTSLIFLGGMLLAALLLRRRLPLFSFGILFYLAAHLVESTVIGLELYFEHRNYMAALFLFLPIAVGIVRLADIGKPSIAVLVAFMLLAMLGSMTWQRSSLWSSSDQLELFWARSSPGSPRAQSAIATYLFNQGRVDEAEEYLEAAARRLPESSLLTVRVLLQKVHSGVATHMDFSIGAAQLARQPFDAQTVAGLRSLVEAILEQGNHEYAAMTMGLLVAMDENSSYRNFPLFLRLIPYLKGQLSCLLGKGEESLINYSKAMSLYADVEAGLMMAAEMASCGYREHALVLLGEARTLLDEQDDSTLRRPRDSYEMEIERLEAILHSAKNDDVVKRDL